MFQYKDSSNTISRTRRLYCIICMILILILAIIHFGVSLSILEKFRHYGNIFHPERGLAGFNLVISILGIIIAGFGLFSVLTSRGVLSMYTIFFFKNNYFYIEIN